MSIDDASATMGTKEWWSTQRGHYNFGFLIAGVIAFASCQVVACTAIIRVDPQLEITVFTILFQSFIFSVAMLVALGVANLFYSLGPLSERLVRPRKPEQFRSLVYGLGFWFSVLLPFCVPALLLYLAIFHPNQFQHDEFIP